MLKVTLNDVCDVTDGTHYTPPNTGGPFPFLTVKDMTDNGLSFSGCSYIDGNEFEKARRVGACPEAGAVLFSKDGTVGKVHVVRHERPFAVLSSIAILRPDSSRLDSNFLGFILGNSEVLKDAVNRKTGSALQRLILSDLKDVSIPLPELPEQRRIAERLEQADRLRRTRHYALELIESFLPAAFFEVFGDPTTNPLGLSVAELGDFLSFVTSGSRGWAEYYSPVGARFIRSLDVRMNNISDEDAVFVKPPNGAEADRTRVKNGDVLLTITGSRIGRVAPVPERLNGAFISQHVAILRLKSGLLPQFLSMFLSLGSGGQLQIARAQYGQTKPGLNLDQIRELRVPVPQVCHQERFLELAKRVESLRAVQREALRQAEHLFLSLLDRAFSG
jgi:type I restriction enzyme, S subunit